MGEPKFSLISFSGALGAPYKADPLGTLGINPLELDDVDAGIWTLSMLVRRYPNLKWGDLVNGKLSGWWTNLKKSASDLGDWVGDKSGSIGDKLGEWGGDAIRLFADEEVRDGVKEYSAAYMTGGKSAGIQGMLESFSKGKTSTGDQSSLTAQFTDLLKSIGIGTKQDIQQASMGDMNFNPMWLVGGLGVGLVLVLLTAGRK